MLNQMNNKPNPPKNINQNFKSALKFEIELLDGSQSQLITIFNGSEVNFEDLVKHTETALSDKTNNNIKSVQTTLGYIGNGFFENVAIYNKVIF